MEQRGAYGERETPRLAWSCGGWFGGQLGSTAWILVGAILAAVHDPATGALLLLLWAVPNAVGVFLWRRRAQRSCHASLQLLVAVMALCGLGAVEVLDGSGLWETVQVGAKVPAPVGYAVVLLVFVGLMAFFFLRFGRHEDRG